VPAGLLVVEQWFPTWGGPEQESLRPGLAVRHRVVVALGSVVALVAALGSVAALRSVAVVALVFVVALVERDW
jgi:hypothetical protein